MLHTTVKHLLFLTLVPTWCQAREEEVFPVSSNQYTANQEIQKAPEEILHYPVSSGRYTVKEEIQKAPTENHFCNLTRTSVKISFPEMKSETFVNFLGYKEPNLVHLAHCKGMCGEGGNSMSCVAK